MINSRIYPLLTGLIWAFTCGILAAQEPNQYKPELKFEISNQEQPWLVEIGQNGQGPIQPSHVAILFLGYRQNFPDFSSPVTIKSILSTPSGKSLSQKQMELLTTGTNCISRLGKFGDTVPNHYHFRLYATSEEDAKKMVQAFLEVCAAEANENIQQFQIKKLELEKNINKVKERLMKTDPDIKTAQTKLDELKNTVHYLSTDEAKQTIIEMSKMLNNLQVEVAGVYAKWTETSSFIERLEAKQKIEAKNSEARTNTESIRLKLEEMKIDLAIELEVLKAKEKTAGRIRMDAENFCNLNQQIKQLEEDKNNLRTSIPDLVNSLEGVENRLANPDNALLPPKVFENKVTIYPVQTQ